MFSLVYICWGCTKVPKMISVLWLTSLGGNLFPGQAFTSAPPKRRRYWEIHPWRPRDFVGRRKSPRRRGWISQLLPSYVGAWTFSHHQIYCREWISKFFPVDREGFSDPLLLLMRECEKQQSFNSKSFNIDFNLNSCSYLLPQICSAAFHFCWRLSSAELWKQAIWCWYNYHRLNHQCLIFKTFCTGGALYLFVLLHEATLCL